MLVGVTFIICSPPQVRATERVCSGLVDLLHRPLSRHAELIAHTEAVRIGEALRRSLAVSAGPVPAFLELFGLGVGVIVRVAVAVLVLTVAGLGDARVDGLIHIVAVTADVRDVALRGFAGGDPAFVEAIAVAIVVGVPGRHVDGVAVDHGVAVVVEAVADLDLAGVHACGLIIAVGVDRAGAERTAEGGRLVLQGLIGIFFEEAAVLLVLVIGAGALFDLAAGDGLPECLARTVPVAVFVVVPCAGVVGDLAVTVLVHVVADLGRTRVDRGVLVVAVLARRVAVTVRVAAGCDELLFLIELPARHEPETERCHEPDALENSREVEHGVFLRPLSWVSCHMDRIAGEVSKLSCAELQELGKRELGVRKYRIS